MNWENEAKFGKNIQKCREKAHITQELLAVRLQIMGCDITRSAIAKIEAGQRHVYPDEIKLIKDILQVSYDELFDFEIEENREKT